MKIAICGQADAHKAHQLGTLRRNDVGSTGLKTTTIIMTTKPTMTGHGDSVCCASSSIRSPTWRRITSANSSGPSCPLASQRAPSWVMLAKSESVMWMHGVKSCDATLRQRRGATGAAPCAPWFRSRREVLATAFINPIAPVSLLRPPPPSRSLLPLHVRECDIAVPFTARAKPGQARESEVPFTARPENQALKPDPAFAGPTTPWIFCVGKQMRMLEYLVS